MSKLSKIANNIWPGTSPNPEIMQFQLIILTAIVASAIAAPVAVPSSSKFEREELPEVRYR